MNVGKTIAELRKKNNMTQIEVADILGVSYQAVSKWERDESLPDIALLPQIADLFHITIDQLLRGGFEINQEEDTKEIATESLNNEITEFVHHELEKENPPVDELGEKISNFVENTINNVFEGFKPFKKTIKESKTLDEDTMNILLNNIDDFNDEALELLTEIISKASSNTIDIIIDKLNQSDIDFDEFDISEIILFLNDSQQEKLILTNLFKIEKDMIIDCLPFLNENLLDEIISTYLLKDDIEDFDEFYPFLSDETKKHLMNYYANHKMLDEISELLDFMK